jgi:hypothetical protein
MGGGVYIEQATSSTSDNEALLEPPEYVHLPVLPQTSKTKHSATILTASQVGNVTPDAVGLNWKKIVLSRNSSFKNLSGLNDDLFNVH